MLRISEGREFHCFGAQLEKERWSKTFSFNMGIINNHVSTGRSCMVYTVGRSKRQAGDESEKKLRHIVDSLQSILAWTGNLH